MSVPAVMVAVFGLGLAVYAALETEPEEIRRRAAFGVLGVVLLVLGIVMI
jgi:ABC-type phosphate transport system permease subunit